MADTAPRIPAWKRLGLKLKYAQDTSPVQALPNTTTTTTSAPASNGTPTMPASRPPKRAIEDSITAPETPAKRAKPTPERQAFDFSKPKSFAIPEEPVYVPKRYGFAGVSVQPAGKKITFGDDDTDLPVIVEAKPKETEQPAKTRPALLRKSVSFTPDTKQKDGESGQKYFKAWASGQDPTAVIPSAEENSPSKPSKEEKEKKEKKVKKPRKSKSTTISEPKTSTKAKDESESSTASKETPVYLEYLQQYFTDRTNWRFKKSNQNALLKNLFNIYRIPEEHNPAIIAYLNGLQGSARDRVALQAEDVLKDIYEGSSPDETMSLDSPAARKHAYYAALTRQIQRYEESGAGRSEYNDDELRKMREETIKGRRAREVLEHGLLMELRPETYIPPSPAPGSTATPEAAPTQTAEPATKNKRKRKARTDVSSSSDSSSSDSSSSDSDSDSEVPKAKKARKQGIFDNELLDFAFGDKKSSKKTSGLGAGNIPAKTMALANGTRGKEDDSDTSSSDSSSDSDSSDSD